MSAKQSKKPVVAPTEEEELETLRKSMTSHGRSSPFDIVFGISLAIAVLSAVAVLFYSVVNS